MLTLLLVALRPAAAAVPDQGLTTEDSLAQLALKKLREVAALNRALPRLHASEDLVLLGYQNPLNSLSNSDLKALGDSGYRIVFWRVRAREAKVLGTNPKKWIDSIDSVFLSTPPASDQVDAAESLGKLGFFPSAEKRPPFESAAAGSSQLAVEARWILANGGGQSEEDALAAFLKSPQADIRSSAAYAFRFKAHIAETTQRLLLSCARAEPLQSSARAYLFSSALVHARPDERPQILSVVEEYIERGSRDDAFEALNCMALVGSNRELRTLVNYLKKLPPYSDENADLQVGASNAILHILKR